MFVKSCTTNVDYDSQIHLLRFYFLSLSLESVFAPSYKLIEVIGCFTHVIWFIPVIISVQSLRIYMATDSTKPNISQMNWQPNDVHYQIASSSADKRK